MNWLVIIHKNMRKFHFGYGNFYNKEKNLIW